MFLIPDGDGAEHPQTHYEKLINCEEHAHLKLGEPNVAFLFRVAALQEQGRQIIGTCFIPTVQGRLRHMFEWMMEEMLGSVPDFLFVLDHDWWFHASPLEREILMFHEMMHAGQAKDRWGSPRFNKDSGKPVWAIRGHDVEEFTATVSRYGAWQPEIASFVAACNQTPKFNHD